MNMQGARRELQALDEAGEVQVPEDVTKLRILQRLTNRAAVDGILQVLKEDRVALIPGVDPREADEIMQGVAEQLGLHAALELQAGFATIRGHRERIGKYYMTVNKRDDYQFISPHSEGSSFSSMQLASFLCYENSTDGGETILMHVNSTSSVWNLLREKVARGSFKGQTPTRRAIAKARALYRMDLAESAIKDDDQILQERATEIPGLQLVDVLAKPRKTSCRILNTDLYVYWDSIASIDLHVAKQYAALLQQCRLLKEPPGAAELVRLDNAWARRIWQSGAKFEEIFDCKISKKLCPGDLLILNNLTWTHSAANWSPESGIRAIAAAFA